MEISDYLGYVPMESGSSLIWIAKTTPKNTRLGKMAGSPGGLNLSYWSVGFNGKLIKAHHIVWYLHNHEWPKQLDHINKNPHDNRIENLRVCTNSENQFNKSTYKNNLSKTKGLYFIKRLNKWAAVVYRNKKQHWIGTFEDKELAEFIIYEARKKYHGKFASHQ